MVLGCGWLLNGDVKFLAGAAKRDGSASPSSCRRSTPAHKASGFPRRQRLTKEADLELVRRTGKRMQTESLEARVSASLLLYPRVGVVVPKYRRNIVDRNRTKRRLRELARLKFLPTIGRVDVLLRAKPQAYDSSFAQLATEVNAIVEWASAIATR
jgi:ribonuclease P protein component